MFGHRSAPMGCDAVQPSDSRLPADLGGHQLSRVPLGMPKHLPAHMTGLMLALMCWLALGVPSLARADAALSQQKNCNACHAMEGTITGPSLKAMAQKYANDRTAADKLTTRILKGGVGVWGPVPMPSQTSVSDADATALATWILAGAK
jgi:cytochrome c